MTIEYGHVRVGELAPDFTLPDQHGTPVTLSQLRGENSIVLMFYPFAFTPVCTVELGSMQDLAGQFADLGARVLGVSCDTIYTLKAFSESQGLTKPTLLSDFWPHGEVSQRYGAFLADKGFATRATYIIDRSGVVRWKVVTDPMRPRDPSDYMTALARLRDEGAEDTEGTKDTE